MPKLNLLYDVTDLNVLVAKDIAQIFYRLYNSHTSDNGLTPESVLEDWYAMKLDLSMSVLFKHGSVRTLILRRLGHDLFNALDREIHPAFERLMNRMVVLPSHLYDQEVEKVEVVVHPSGSQVLKISFNDYEKPREFVENARDTANKKFLHGAIEPHPLFRIK